MCLHLSTVTLWNGRPACKTSSRMPSYWRSSLSLRSALIFWRKVSTANQVVRNADDLNLVSLSGNVQYFTFDDTKTEITSLALSFYSGLFAYNGWNYLNFIIEELKDPVKNLPKAIAISLVLVTLVYLFTNIGELLTCLINPTRFMILFSSYSILHDSLADGSVGKRGSRRHLRQ